MNQLIPEQARKLFLNLSINIPEQYNNILNVFSSKLIEQSRNWIRPGPNNDPARIANRLFDKEFSKLPPDINWLLRVTLMAKLALKTPHLVEAENYPDSILAYYPAKFNQLSKFLVELTGQPFHSNKNIFEHVGFALGVNIPCGAQLLDLRSSIPLQSVILSVARERSFASLIRYFYYKSYGIWFRGHTDIEYLEEFNEQGWDNFYLRIAQLLLSRKNVRGLVGTSWFYDPQLVNISPRLAYLQQRQLERGAYLMRHRFGGEFDIKFATATSSSRLRLYQEGKYTPVSYSLIWRRSELLSWAKTINSFEKGVETNLNFEP